MFLLLFPGLDDLSRTGGGKYARVHAEKLLLAGDGRIRDQVQVLLGHAVEGNDPCALRSQRVNLIRQRMFSVHHVSQLKRRDRIMALLPEHLRHIRGVHRRFRVDGDICLMKRYAVHQKVASGYNPSGGGEAGRRQRNILLPEKIQHGVGLPSEVAPEGRIDALAVDDNLRRCQKLYRIIGSLIGLLR